MDLPAPPSCTYRFDAFALDPARRTLRYAETPLALPDRMFDALLCLVRKQGQLVEHAELLRCVWAGRYVNEGSVHRAISSLRKALREAGAQQELIATSPTRGYRFIADVQVIMPPEAPEGVTEVEKYAPPGATPAANPAPSLAWPALARPRLPAAFPAVAAALAMIAVALLFLWLGRHGPAPAAPAGTAGAGTASVVQIPSVAVLDFNDNSSTPGQAYVARGLADELAGSLGRLAALRVAARTSSHYISGKNMPVQEMARQLGVSSLLEGSVRQEGAHVRVNVQLIDGSTGFQTWSQGYDRNARDALDLQASIAEAVAGALKLQLAGSDIAALSIGGTRSAAAFDAYLRGINSMKDRASAAAVATAIADFNEAVLHDANYSMAFAMRARARVFALLDTVAPSRDATQSTLRQARADAEHAIALAPLLGFAHSTLGYVLKFGLSDFARAGTEFATAVRLAPNDATVLASYAFFELGQGNVQQGTALAEKAACLDPLSPATYRMLAAAYLLAHRFDDASAALRHAILLEPAPTGEDHVYGWSIALRRGDLAEAVRLCAAEKDSRDQFCLAVALHGIGQSDQAQQHFDKLRAQLGENGAFEYAQIYAQWGQADNAVLWLRKAYDLRDPSFAYLKTDPMLDSIRTAPGYLSIVHQIDAPSGDAKL